MVVRVKMAGHEVTLSRGSGHRSRRNPKCEKINKIRNPENARNMIHIQPWSLKEPYTLFT